MLGGELCAKPKLCSVADASKCRSMLDSRVVLGGMITLDGRVVLGGMITLDGRVKLGGMITLDGGVMLGGIITLDGGVVLGGTIMFNRKYIGVRDKGGLIVIGTRLRSVAGLCLKARLCSIENVSECEIKVDSS
ncbi:hypothetical protein C8R44DRAFT_186204 [Mycena epipterygia]|nr:hypothetical protein C8R44DRAFT_186204 [Mycena epipterygia]